MTPQLEARLVILIEELTKLIQILQEKARES